MAFRQYWLSYNGPVIHNLSLSRFNFLLLCLTDSISLLLSHTHTIILFLSLSHYMHENPYQVKIYRLFNYTVVWNQKLWIFLWQATAMLDSNAVTGASPSLYMIDNSGSAYMGQVTTGNSGSTLPFNFTLDYNLQVCITFLYCVL